MHNDYVIITDSTIDLSPDHAGSLGLVVIPYTFRIEDREYHNYLDDRELSSKDFYNALRGGKTATTSLVTEQRYKDIFEPFLQQGKDILYMCLSTGLTGSYGQSLLAAEALAARYPERKLIMIDTLCASMGQGLLAHYVSKARGEGKTLEEAADYARRIIPHIGHWVRADDLHHLRRGGRVSGASAFMGTMLSIKPMIHMDNEGRLIPVAKARGRANSLQYIIDRYLEDKIDEPHPVVFISHSDAPEEAAVLAEMAKKQAGPREIIINPIGPVIGAHTGPGTLAFFFMAKKR